MPKGGPVSNGRPKVATITRVGGRKQMISWVDAPDDVFFVATEMTRSVSVCPSAAGDAHQQLYACVRRRVRRQLPSSELRRGARKPWRRVGPKHLGGISNNNHVNHNSNNTNGNSLHAMDLGQMA